MSVSIATMGKYWPQAGYGIRESDGIGGGGGIFYEQKRKSVASVTFRKKRKKRISVNVSLKEK